MLSASASQQRSPELSDAEQRSDTPRWFEDVTGIIADLETMNRVTEEDFLAVGEKLIGFLTAARDIRADFGRLAELISGESGERECQALATVLNRATEMQEDVERTNQTLSNLRSSAVHIHRGFSGFEDIILSFQVVGTLGRIETARLGSAHSDLGYFADAVRSSGLKIQTRVGHALGAAAALQDRIDSIINYVSAQDRHQLEALPSLLCTVREGLKAFRARQQETATTSASLANEFGSLTEGLNGLVAALQFHDITRQRIEHAIESLKQLLNTRGTRGRASLPSPEETAVLELQARQLLGAGAAFAASVQGVKQGLEQIATRGRVMGQETMALLGGAAEDQQQASFFGQMESCFTDVLAGIANCAALNKKTAQAVEELELTIERLASCVHDIRTTTSDINQLAINATIQSAHLGAIGAPLNVIAGALQSLHVDARERMCETGNLLAALATAVVTLKPPMAQRSPAPAHSDRVGVIDELRARIDELHVSSEDSLRSRERISGAAARLYSDVQAASDRFNIGVLVERTIARCSRRLQSIGSGSGSDMAGGNFALEHLTAQYTMLAERDVHEKATKRYIDERGLKSKVGPSPEEPALMAGSAPPCDPGENVELF